MPRPTTARAGQKRGGARVVPPPDEERSAARIVHPRIEDGGTAVAHIANIPGNEVKVVLERRCSHERVDHGRWMSGPSPHRAADRTPPADDSIGNGDEPVGEPKGQAVSRGHVERSTRVV